MYEIRMAHPGRNALGTDLMNWLDAELSAAGEEPVLLTGSGDAFCAGLDLKELVSTAPEDMPRFLGLIDHFAARLFDHPAPTVAWINGHAIAGGCVLALCCDYRVASRSPRARMGVNEVALGACYPPRVLRIVRERLDASHCHEVLLGAQLYDLEESLRLGLIDEVAEDGETRARQWLDRLAAHPSETYRITKAHLHRGVTEVSDEEQASFLADEIPIWNSDGIKQRVMAILGG